MIERILSDLIGLYMLLFSSAFLANGPWRRRQRSGPAITREASGSRSRCRRPGLRSSQRASFGAAAADRGGCGARLGSERLPVELFIAYDDASLHHVVEYLANTDLEPPRQECRVVEFDDAAWNRHLAGTKNDLQRRIDT
jgi:hypothetical protein